MVKSASEAYRETNQTMTEEDSLSPFNEWRFKRALEKAEARALKKVIHKIDQSIEEGQYRAVTYINSLEFPPPEFCSGGYSLKFHANLVALIVGSFRRLGYSVTYDKVLRIDGREHKIVLEWDKPYQSDNDAKKEQKGEE